METILGGVYLIRSRNIDYHNDLPEDILSPVECGVCDLYPQYYPYLDYREKNAKKDQEELKLNDSELNAYEKYLEGYFLDECGRWSPVFKSIKDAEFFKNEFLKHLSDVHILVISLTETDNEKFLHELSLGHDKDESYGVRNTLKMKQVSDSFGKFLGFYVLGFAEGYFHCPICYSLIDEISSKLSHQINKYAKYDSYDAALEISEYLQEEYAEVNVGESFWLPWAVWKV